MIFKILFSSCRCCRFSFFGFVSCSTMAIFVFVLFNVFICMFARSGGKELLDSIPSNVHVNTIFLGNSTMACGLDLNTYIDGCEKNKDSFLHKSCSKNF